jgi:hypothetical protein
VDPSDGHVHQKNIAHNTTNTQYQHNEDDLLWRNMIIIGIHSKILINQKILLFLTTYFKY